MPMLKLRVSLACFNRAIESHWRGNTTDNTISQSLQVTIICKLREYTPLLSFFAAASLNLVQNERMHHFFVPAYLTSR